MSRSQPDEGSSNPCRRWFQWESNDGTFSYWDKENKERVKIVAPFTFLVLDILAGVTGFNEMHQKGIYSNETRTRRLGKVPLKVCVHGVSKPIAEGLWRDIKTEVKQFGGQFCQSLYILCDVDGEQHIANIRMKGAALGAWMDFADKLKDIYAGSINWDGETEQGKKGAVSYLMPVFTAEDASEELTTAAYEKDKELQKYLTQYFVEHEGDTVVKEAEPEDRSGKIEMPPQEVMEGDDPNIPF